MTMEIPNATKPLVGFWKHKSVTASGATTYTPNALFPELANSDYVVATVVPQGSCSANGTYVDGSFRVGTVLTSTSQVLQPFFGAFTNIHLGAGSTADIYVRPMTLEEKETSGL